MSEQNWGWNESFEEMNDETDDNYSLMYITLDDIAANVDNLYNEEAVKYAKETLDKIEGENDG